MPFAATISTPAEITGNLNNYDLGGTAATLYRISSDASRNITGILAPGGNLAVKKILLVNVGANDIVLQNENVGSTAANRIITGTGADLTVAADATEELYYDSTSSRWRIW